MGETNRLIFPASYCILAHVRVGGIIVATWRRQRGQLILFSKVDIDLLRATIVTRQDEFNNDCSNNHLKSHLELCRITPWGRWLNRRITSHHELVNDSKAEQQLCSSHSGIFLSQLEHFWSSFWMSPDRIRYLRPKALKPMFLWNCYISNFVG